MTENLQTPENETTPNEREILNMFEQIIDGDFEIARSLEDEEGLHTLEVKSLDADGDLVLHTYTRAGNRDDIHAAETTIDVVLHMGDMPVGGHVLKKYIGGQWIDIAN